MCPPANTITINTAPMASGASAPAPWVGLVAVQTVRTRKNVPMNSATRRGRRGGLVSASRRLVVEAGAPVCVGAAALSAVVTVDVMVVLKGGWIAARGNCPPDLASVVIVLRGRVQRPGNGRSGRRRGDQSIHACVT